MILRIVAFFAGWLLVSILSRAVVRDRFHARRRWGLTRYHLLVVAQILAMAVAAVVTLCSPPHHWVYSFVGLELAYSSVARHMPSTLRYEIRMRRLRRAEVKE